MSLFPLSLYNFVPKSRTQTGIKGISQGTQGCISDGFGSPSTEIDKCPSRVLPSGSTETLSERVCVFLREKEDERRVTDQEDMSVMGKEGCRKNAGYVR